MGAGSHAAAAAGAGADCKPNSLEALSSRWARGGAEPLCSKKLGQGSFLVGKHAKLVTGARGGALNSPKLSTNCFYPKVLKGSLLVEFYR